MKNRFTSFQGKPVPDNNKSICPTGFILINLGAEEKKRLRAMAKESGLTLRDVLGFALRNAARFLETEVRLTRATGLKKQARAAKFEASPVETN